MNFLPARWPAAGSSRSAGQQPARCRPARTLPDRRRSNSVCGPSTWRLPLPTHRRVQAELVRRCRTWAPTGCSPRAWAAHLLRARLPAEAAAPLPGQRPVAAAAGRTQLLLPRRGADCMSSIKPVNQKAWLLILPVVICVAFSAILPLMTVVNYSVQDIFGPERRVFVGTEWFAAVLRDEELHGALLRQLGFSLAVLAGRDPAGHRAGAVDAGQGLEIVGRAGAGGAVAADSVERGRHHLADLRPHRHRPARRHARTAGHRLQLHRQRHGMPGSRCW